MEKQYLKANFFNVLRNNFEIILLWNNKSTVSHNYVLKQIWFIK